MRDAEDRILVPVIDPLTSSVGSVFIPPFTLMTGVIYL